MSLNETDQGSIVKRLAPSLFGEYGNWHNLSGVEREEIVALAKLANLYRALLLESDAGNYRQIHLENEQSYGRETVPDEQKALTEAIPRRPKSDYMEF